MNFGVLARRKRPNSSLAFGEKLILQFSRGINEDDDATDFVDDAPLIKENSAQMHHTKARAMSLFRKQIQKDRETDSFPPIWTMIYLMWSAPITKFWTSQVRSQLHINQLRIPTMIHSKDDKSIKVRTLIWNLFQIFYIGYSG